MEWMARKPSFLTVEILDGESKRSKKELFAIFYNSK